MIATEVGDINLHNSAFQRYLSVPLRPDRTQQAFYRTLANAVMQSDMAYTLLVMQIVMPYHFGRRLAVTCETVIATVAAIALMTVSDTYTLGC
jgi:hypothetical protein